MPGMDQRVVVADPESGIELPEGRVGEVWISGPSVAAGYWRNPEATARDFRAWLASPVAKPGEGPFLRTGDLGFFRDGELYVTGRLKDLVIIRGRNHYPQDLELTAERSHPDLRPGNGAAFAVDVTGEERLVIVHEVERRVRAGHEEVAEAVRRAVAEEHEVQVHEVVLVRTGTVPKTSSGKIQRRLCRQQYLDGELAVVGRSALDAPRTAAGGTPELSRGALLALEPAERAAILEAWLRQRAAEAIGTRAVLLDPGQPLTGMGLDSLAAIELKGGVETALGVSVPLADLLEGAGTRLLAERLLPELEASEGEPLPKIPPLRRLESAGDHPLSAGQKAMWFLERLAPEAGAYNIAVAARVAPELDADALRRALVRLAERHPAFRTVFPTVGEEPVQRVLETAEVDFRVETPGGGAHRETGRGGLAAVPARPRAAAACPGFRRAGRPGSALRGAPHRGRLLVPGGGGARPRGTLRGGDRRAGGRSRAALPGLYRLRASGRRKSLTGPRGERLWAYWRDRLAGGSPGR